MGPTLITESLSLSLTRRSVSAAAALPLFLPCILTIGGLPLTFWSYKFHILKFFPKVHGFASKVLYIVVMTCQTDQTFPSLTILTVILSVREGIQPSYNHLILPLP